MNESAFPFVSLVSVVVMLVSLNPTPTQAQKAARPVPATPKAAVETGEVNLTAVSASVSESASPVKIRILRWSTDEERNPVVAALTPSAPVTAPADVAAGSPPEAGLSPDLGRILQRRGARRGARGGRGGAGAAGRAGAGAVGGEAPARPDAEGVAVPAAQSHCGVDGRDRQGADRYI